MAASDSACRGWAAPISVIRRNRSTRSVTWKRCSSAARTAKRRRKRSAHRRGRTPAAARATATTSEDYSTTGGLFEQAAVERDGHGLGAAGGAELGHDAGQVDADGFLADEQF